MQRPKRWTLSQAQPEAAASLAERLRTSPLVAQILINRGLLEADDCRSFLKPSLKCLHDPATIPGLLKAADRIARAIRDREKIVVYGDYDVDGITATAILWHAITRLGGVVAYYIPHRIEEGYGLNAEAVAEICDGGAKLIVTVDCGITAIGPAKVAHERGVDLIITDHHEWHETAAPLTDGESELGPILPRTAYAIVHPRLPDSSLPDYPNKALCGAGVAFKLAWGLGQAVNGKDKVSDDFREFLLDATALAALGTIADVVPLVGENRILAFYGLGGLTKTKLRGIRALIASAGLTGQALDSFHVGFLLAPRLNAAGRMGHAKLAVEMLTDASAERATEIADYLEGQNRQRQGTEKDILAKAVEQVRQLGYDGDGCHAIVLGGEGWHPGVIGIVASRIVDRYHRPTVMVALNDGHGSGSGRSINGFHLARALEACGDHLDAYGGHEMAAGLKVRSGNFEAFRAAFCAHAATRLSAEQLMPVLKLDVAVPDLRHVTQALCTDLKRLGPFGHGNRKPVLQLAGLQVAAPPRRVGKSGDHLALFVRQPDGASMKAIAFNHGHLLEKLSVGTVVDLAVEPTLNEWNGRTSVELDVKDVRFAGR
ncbi:MAG TPA: single-stranded-DNA-specific exonuclease RecJ [Tepidisphaeraceae bacterium]|nr:single-stranded-DNA-specific exonuclease RecJ [Tepidisphaeraceae bacterium]